MMLTPPYNTDPDNCVRIVHAALNAGINFINSADGYGNGQAEEVVGKALVGRRDEVVISTKVRIASVGNPNSGGASRRTLIRSVESALKRLQTDRIDLYILSHPDMDTDIEESLSVLTDLVRQGKIVSFGCSKYPAEQIVESQWVAEQRNLMRFRCEESPYSIFTRQIEASVAPVCERYGMGLIVFGTLAGSWLTGRYRKTEDIDFTHPRVAHYRARFDLERSENVRKLELVVRLEEIARDAGISLVHMATAFAMAHPTVTSAIIGPRTMEQLTDVLGGTGVVLDDETLDHIDAIVGPGVTVAPASPHGTPALENPVLRRRPLNDRAAG